MLQFSPNILRDWESQGIKYITLKLVQTGCEGTEVRISLGGEKHTHLETVGIKGTDIICLLDTDETALRNTDSYLTHIKGKWILKNDRILTRCGCGKSFSFSSGNPMKDKIRLLRSELHKKHKLPEHHH